jgi:HlyD family secretion protein/epimerase transport system membrane fusion protein
MKRVVNATRRLFNSRRELAPAAADFHPSGSSDPSDVVRLRLRRPILLGSLITLVLVFGLLIWAAFFSISGAVVAAGTVRVEDNVKQLRYREGGIVRQILVHEGQLVQRGQVLLRFDQVTTQATVDILNSTLDSLLAQVARFQAEAAGAPEIRFPPELLARQADPAVAQLLAGQRALFQARMTLYRSQAGVLRGQAGQLQTQIAGLRAQAVATDAQSGLIDDELKGVADLNRLGYAPRSRLLALQRSAAQLKGQRGSVTSDIGRTTQAAGDISLQIAQLDDRRQTDAADGLRDAQEKLADTIPKLRAAQEQLAQTTVRSPVTGYVFNLTQFTEGGVAQPGESLMQVVPVNEPLEITAMVRPTDIAEIRVGMPARVTLTAYNPRTTPQVDGTVVLVGADAQVDEATKATFYTVRIKVPPAELARAGRDVHLTPGMPASISIITGSRTIMDYLLGPMTEAMRTAMRER